MAHRPACRRPALAEQHHVAGERVITAYALGWEIQGRLRAASAPATRPGYHPPGLVGPLGGAAASAKTLGLDAQQTLMALGIAASRTGGLTANTGTMVKSTHPGNAARMGAEAGILAGMGYTASDEALESPVGYAAALFGGEFDWEIAPADWDPPPADGVSLTRVSTSSGSPLRSICRTPSKRR